MDKKGILLLVDDISLERVISLMLKQADYQVISGVEASEVLKNISFNDEPGQDFDAVISCIQGSSMDGSKIISLIRKKYKQVPVMAIIPYGSERDDMEMLKRRGKTSILHSPFETDELLECLGNVFVKNT